MAEENNEYVNRLSKKNLLGRAIWNIVYITLFRPFGTKIFRQWRNFLLRCFGAKIHKRAGVYSSCKVYAPWNLIMDRNAWLGPNVICYNVDMIHLGEDVTVSQYSHLCTASHNINTREHELITARIKIENQAWVGAEAFVGMGVTIHEGAVVGARAAVFKDVDAWTVVGGNPAKFIKKRELRG